MRLTQFVFLFILSSCITETFTESRIVEGYVPVYGEITKSEIKFSPARVITNPGKIYTYQNFLFVNERNVGVHVFNNQDPSHPQPVTFIEILGNNDIAIKNDILYADHMGDLVALRLNDFQQVEKLAGLPLKGWTLGLPAPRGAYFECIDQNKGLVVAWKKEILNNPDCYAF